MQFKKLMTWVTPVLVAGALASCNIGKAPEPTVDANAIYTSAAKTLSAGLGVQETQTAKAIKPTAISSPTALASLPALATFPVGTNSVPFGTPPVVFGTPKPGTTPGLPTLPAGGGGANTAVGCDNSAYVSETDPLDKTQIKADKEFTKGWQMQNTGTCTWGEGYSWAFVSGENMGCNNVVYKANDTATTPGHSNTFIVHCTAPSGAGEYKGFWQMKNASGTAFGVSPWVDIVVP